MCGVVKAFFTVKGVRCGSGQTWHLLIEFLPLFERVVLFPEGRWPGEILIESSGWIGGVSWT